MNITKENVITRDTKADQVYHRIKESILRGEMAPGEKLVIHQLAKFFNTSIIPVREAISRLESDDLIKVVPHTCICVKGINPERLKEIYPIRGILEGHATRLAAGRLKPSEISQLREMIKKMDDAIASGNSALMGQLNTEFHMEIYRASSNQTLIHMIDDLWQKTILARLIFKFTPERAAVSNREHRAIVLALEKKEAKKAERLIIRQNEETLGTLIRHLAGIGEAETMQNDKK